MKLSQWLSFLAAWPSLVGAKKRLLTLYEAKRPDKNDYLISAHADLAVGDGT